MIELWRREYRISNAGSERSSLPLGQPVG
jgi:hypothetical protein